ncbi:MULTISPECIES: non-ribosomal peptide synthetase [Paenibacillus]|uniref:non-ribosomal peptide synthetase n=1 Tax=Paenibacillus TaxID=44249 RepID=UPI0022B90B1C|nr:non-ribosomal peptide synthetase [Paenibacillus caseinilyticus]MCZ8519460.1 amino acid adenylation domain-containing protein [Paenibacillus caseinilyticus]
MSRNPAIENIYALSPLQQGILFHSIGNAENGAYYESLDMTFLGEVDVPRFEQAMNGLIRRYEVLRTAFLYEDLAKPRQVVLRERPFNAHYEDLTALGSGEREAYLREWSRKDAERGFNLQQDPLLRVSLFRVGPQEYRCMWRHHHIILDGWCLGILFRELLDTYASLKEGGLPSLPPAPKYASYIAWLEKRDPAEAKAYWQPYVEGLDALTGLPQSEKRGTGYRHEVEVLIFSEAVTEQLQQLARTHSVTLNIVVQALWGLLLQAYNDCDDAVFGAVVSGRPALIPDVEKLVGLCINTIPVRLRDRQMTFEEVLRALQEASLASEPYSTFPLHEIQALNQGQTALFDHLLAFENFPFEGEVERLCSPDATGFRITNVLFREQTNYNLDITVIPGPQLTMKFSYNACAYSKETILRMTEHLRRTVDWVLRHPDRPVRELCYVPEEEAARLLAWNGPAEGIPAGETIHGLFAKQAARTPDAVALVAEDGELTYRQLQERTRALAEELRAEGIGAGCFVGVLAERSIGMVCAALAVLKAGAAYVPLDAALPESRLLHIAASLSMRAVAATPAHGAQAVALLQASPFMHCVMDAERHTVIGRQTGTDEAEEGQTASYAGSVPPSRQAGPEDPAYAIFTSGSTGTPKGVIVPHRPVVNLLTWVNETYAVGPQDRVLFVTSLSFDLSVYDIFGLLAAGGSVRIVPEQDLRSPQRLLQLLQSEPVTLWDSAPAALAQLEPFFPEAAMAAAKLRLVLLSGDWIPLTLTPAVRRVFPGARVIALGGATEAAVWSNFHEVGEINPDWTSIPYGRPIRGARYYVLDSRGQLCPVGVPGELYIGGECLAAGYAGDPSLTAERFVPDPYGLYPGARMYRTGDRARWRAGGWLEFLGRADHQVKIRGYRIEPGEIQAALLAHPEITAAVVTARESGAGERALCAYLVSERELPVIEIREFLGSRLPGYMIPSHFVRLPAMPVTANGKLDVKALPAPPAEVLTGAPYEAPRSGAEELLAGLWQEVLQVEKVGVHDPFFSLGGDSIKAIQVMSRLHKHGLRLDVRDFFQYPTIAGLSLHLQAESSTAPQEEISGDSALTPVQKWFFDRLGREAHFNQSVMLYRKDGFREEAVRSVLAALVAHHDALRLVFPAGRTEGRPAVHRPSTEAGFTLECLDLTVSGGSLLESRIEAECSRIQAGMDLERGPLVRLGLFHTGEGDHLLFAVHHLVIDGVSWRILLEDFLTLYSGVNAGLSAGSLLPPKTHPLRDWAAGLERYAFSAGLLQEKSHWRELERGAQIRLPKEETGETGRRTMRLTWPPDLIRKLLQEAGRVYNADMDILLLTALSLTLEEEWGLPGAAVQLEGHGREDLLPELNVTRTVGWFTSMYPVRLPMDKGDGLSRRIKSVKESLRQVPRRGTGYGVLKYLSPAAHREDLAFSLEPEISFNYMGDYQQRLDAEGTEFSPLSGGSSFTPGMPLLYVWNLNAHLEQEALVLDLEYDAGLHRSATMERIAGRLHGQLARLAGHCEGIRESEHTPTDFAYQNLGLDELDELLDEVAAGLIEEE